MSHQVLARKWRPREFDALVGQPHVVRALTHALGTGRLHHAYLFTGTRGVGKTTLARILAKAVNCEVGLGPTPCGRCDACVSIDSGRFVDVIELDAASNRGVDEMTQLLENAVYAPVAGRYKVYVIDEVHMLTHHAFNAMLKTLEEPPAHLLFVLATTDPQKVPVTVLSRCMQFNLRNVRPAEIAGHLANVLDAETVAYEPEALELLGRQAAGSVRDALSLTDQAIAYGAGSLTAAAVRDMLGLLDGRQVDRILDALAEGDGAGLVAVADEIAAENLAPEAVLGDLAERLSALAVIDVLGAGEAGDGDGFIAPARRWQGRFAAADLQVYYQIALHSRRDIGLAPDTRTGLTMALLRMLAFTVEATGAEAPPAAAVASRPPPPVRTEPPVRPEPTGRPPEVPVPRRPAQPPATGGLSSASAALRAVRAARERQQGGGPRPEPSEDPEGAPGTAASAGVRADVASGQPVGPRAGGRVGREADSGAPGFPPEPPPDPDFEPPADSTESDPDAPAPRRRGAVRPQLQDPPGADVSGAQSPAHGSGHDWPALAARLALRGRLGEFMRQSELIDWQGGHIRVRVPIATLQDARLLERVGEALARHLGLPAVRLEAEVGRVQGDTAVARSDAEQRARQQRARETIETDPFVRSVVEDLGASIVPDSIRPVPAPSSGDC